MAGKSSLVGSKFKVEVDLSGRGDGGGGGNGSGLFGWTCSAFSGEMLNWIISRKYKFCLAKFTCILEINFS